MFFLLNVCMFVAVTILEKSYLAELEVKQFDLIMVHIFSTLALNVLIILSV